MKKLFVYLSILLLTSCTQASVNSEKNSQSSKQIGKVVDCKEIPSEKLWTGGTSLDCLDQGEGAQLGASVSIKERNKIAELVDSSVSAGAKIETGAKVPDGDGAFYPATVLTVKKDNPILQQEVFGPVAPVVVIESDEEAIESPNAIEYGLIAYVYSGDTARAIRTAEALEAGMVAINRGVISDPAAPFGGVKQSGLGREGGFDGIHEFLETKYIGINS